MRIVVMFVVAISMAACTKPNPNTCCVTQAQCEELGADELRPCEAGQACQASTCVASECQTSVDCTAADAPICVNNLCVATCAGDDECADVPDRPYCSTESTCVGCTDASQCSAPEAICDATAHACRGCVSDDECASGVCLEADGACATASDIVHVTMFGVDAGLCEKTAPCRTLGFAVQKVGGSRRVIRITGGLLPAESQTLSLTTAMVIDATGTTLQKPFNVPMLVLNFAGRVVVEGVVIRGAPNSQGDPFFVVGSGSTLQMENVKLEDAVTHVMNGSLDLRNSTVSASGHSLETINCDSGTFSAESVTFEHAFAQTTNCQVTVRRSSFHQIGDRTISASGGVVLIENNLIVVSYELADAMSVHNAAPGSFVRFNTFVNTSGVSSDGTALYCDGTVNVTSNIFAYASRHPHSGQNQCHARYSLYDSVALPDQSAGQGNKVADGASFFLNRLGMDFHLSASSPARDGAEPNLPVSTDYDGAARVSPADMGAFEAP